MSVVAETHEMVLSSSLASGAEEWACPRCGRRLVLRWPPRSEKLVLDHGDVTALHVGGKGGVRAGGLTAAVAPSGADQQWLGDIGGSTGMICRANGRFRPRQCKGRPGSPASALGQSW